MLSPTNHHFEFASSPLRASQTPLTMPVSVNPARPLIDPQPKIGESHPIVDDVTKLVIFLLSCSAISCFLPLPSCASCLLCHLSLVTYLFSVISLSLLTWVHLLRRYLPSLSLPFSIHILPLWIFGSLALPISSSSLCLLSVLPSICLPSPPSFSSG